MNIFPLTDPIPLPAPVWIFKILHILTLALHFIAVKILLGSLLVATVLSFLGKNNSLQKSAAAALARRLPVVMTYVINLGVPPLLFAQVLYGPALYTSSVLIGAYWIAIVFLLMACYWTLYKFSDGSVEGKNVWGLGLTALVLAGSISRILSTNMTLMLTPEVWSQMYSLSAIGAFWPPYDSTLMPRWMFMLTGALSVCGLWMVWIGGRKPVEPPLKEYLVSLGGRLAVLGIVLEASQFYFILQNQPQAVKQGLAGNALYHLLPMVWYVLAVVILIFAVGVFLRKPCSYTAGYFAAGLVFLSTGVWTILRDGIRDLTLLSKGYDVWQLPVYTNWSVLILFLGTFGLGLVSLVWLISVMMRAKPIAEGELS